MNIADFSGCGERSLFSSWPLYLFKAPAWKPVQSDKAQEQRRYSVSSLHVQCLSSRLFMCPSSPVCQTKHTQFYQLVLNIRFPRCLSAFLSSEFSSVHAQSWALFSCYSTACREWQTRVPLAPCTHRGTRQALSSLCSPPVPCSSVTGGYHSTCKWHKDNFLGNILCSCYKVKILIQLGFFVFPRCIP